MKLYIDYGGTNFRYLIEDDLKLIESDYLSSKNIDLIDFIEDKVREFKLNFVGISFAGQVKDGFILSSPNINIKRLNIRDYFYSKYKLRVEIENDLKCASLAEYSVRKNAKLLIALYIGTGVGSAYIQNGNLMRGIDNLAGEIGHIPYKKAPFKCGCGKDDCLELFLSGSGIQKWANYNRLEKLETNQKFTDDFYDSLSYVTSLLITIFNPDYLILGGGVINNNLELIDFIKDEVQKRAFKPALKNLKIELSHFKEGSLEGTKFLEN